MGPLNMLIIRLRSLASSLAVWAPHRAENERTSQLEPIGHSIGPVSVLAEQMANGKWQAPNDKWRMPDASRKANLFARNLSPSLRPNVRPLLVVGSLPAALVSPVPGAAGFLARLPQARRLNLLMTFNGRVRRLASRICVRQVCVCVRAHGADPLGPAA